MDRPFYTSVQVCYKCSDRQIGCHSKCEKYLKAKEEADELRKKIHKAKHDEYICLTGRRKRLW